MSGAKVIVLYPTPRDANDFERVYAQDHVPMVNQRAFPGMTKFVASKILGTPDGSAPPFHRLAELHFPSMDALRSAAGSAPAQDAIAHAISISTGGKPLFLVGEEEIRNF